MSNLIEKFRKVFYIDYGILDKEGREWVKEQFTEDCLNRVNVISAIVFFGEIILLVLDCVSGFFAENSLNYINMVGEVLIIVTSFLINVLYEMKVKKGRFEQKGQEHLLDFYKLSIIASVCMFIFTDIYVRQKTIGAYIVFLFVLQVLPYYRAKNNVLVYTFLCVFISVIYLGLVPEAQPGSLFSILAIIFAFAFSTECLRSFSIKKTINTRMNELMTERFSRLASQTILALSNAVEAKDLYTKGHSQRVATYSKEIASRMGYKDEQLDEIYYIGLLHDIGKIGVADTVINKNGRLTDEEFEQIKHHPDMGYEILEIITEIPDISIGAKWHHEKYNGTGYPEGLSGNEIPQIAQIIAVADAYDAMTSTRSYRDVMPQSKVRSEIEKNAGTQFEPGIAAIMLQMIDEDTEYKMCSIANS